jgi:transposase
VNMAGRTETVEVSMTNQCGWRWSMPEKAATSFAAYQEGVAANLLFQWRRHEPEAAPVATLAGESVVPASKLVAAREEIGEFRRILRREGRAIRSASTPPVRCPGMCCVDRLNLPPIEVLDIQMPRSTRSLSQQTLGKRISPRQARPESGHV